MGQAQQKHRAVLIVENDAELRHLTAALFEDEKVDTIECESAEAALAVMLIGGREVAMIFADVRLPGAMGGVDLAWEVKLRWPRRGNRSRDIAKSVFQIHRVDAAGNVIVHLQQANLGADDLLFSRHGVLQCAWTARVAILSPAVLLITRRGIDPSSGPNSI